MRIDRVLAREILDSRGNPTVEVDVWSGKRFGRAAVPSGASTGAYEALELRDRQSRCDGMGVRKAVKNCSIIAKAIIGMDPSEQKRVDEAMIRLDGTQDKSRLGANAILGVSMAVTRLACSCKGIPLYRHIASLSRRKPRLPVPFANVINGGRHAGTDLKIQEFMIAADGARSYPEAVDATIETYHAMKRLIEKRFGKSAANVGDEGGFALPVKKAEDALKIAEDAIAKAGHEKTVHLGLDCAASEFHNKNGLYLLHRQFTSQTLAAYYSTLAERFGLVSIEDPFDQDDLTGFASYTSRSGIQVVGDDLLVSNPKRIGMAIENKLCNALLLKVNQIGTVSEALEAAELAYSAGWKVMVSHRSGETEDPFIADLAVGIGAGQIKLGAPCRGERTAKYNQLTRICESAHLPYGRI